MVKLTTGEKIARDLCEMDSTIGNVIEVDPVDVARRIDEAMLELTEQLAAEQLNNKLLRDALEFLNARIVTMDLGGVVERALSLPPSTEALDAYVAAKVKEAGKFDMWKINPYTKVLETSIKQLTKQRDLAVEALEEVRRSGDTRLASMAIAHLSTIKESEAK